MADDGFSKGFKITCGVIAALVFGFVVVPIGSCLVCGACVAANAPAGAVAGRGQPSALATAIGGTQPESVPAEPVSPAPEGSTEAQIARLLPAHDFNLGDRFKLGAFSYRLTGSYTDRVIGKGFGRLEAASGVVFAVVEYEETNEGQQTVTALEGNLELVDADGRTFQPSSKAMATLAMSGEADLALTQLHPGVPRRAKVAFEIPDGANPVLVVVKARGLSPDRVRVFPATTDGEKSIRAIAVRDALEPLADRDFVKVRSFMHTQDATKTTDADLASMADAMAVARERIGDREEKTLREPVVSDDLVSSHVAFVRPGRRWTKADGGMEIVAREVGGRYYFVRVDVTPPAVPRGKGGRPPR